jgi:2-hydroxychromene-2-carboxylate isomerase
MVVIYRPILQWGPPLDEALSVPWIGFYFFFSFELSYLRAPKKPRLAGVPEVGAQLSLKPLALRTFIVQNGAAWS